MKSDNSNGGKLKLTSAINVTKDHRLHKYCAFLILLYTFLYSHSSTQTAITSLVAISIKHRKEAIFTSAFYDIHSYYKYLLHEISAPLPPTHAPLECPTLNMKYKTLYTCFDRDKLVYPSLWYSILNWKTP